MGNILTFASYLGESSPGFGTSFKITNTCKKLRILNDSSTPTQLVLRGDAYSLIDVTVGYHFICFCSINNPYRKEMQDFSLWTQNIGKSIAIAKNHMLRCYDVVIIDTIEMDIWHDIVRDFILIQIPKIHCLFMITC